MQSRGAEQDSLGSWLEQLLHLQIRTLELNSNGDVIGLSPAPHGTDLIDNAEMMRSGQVLL